MVHLQPEILFVATSGSTDEVDDLSFNAVAFDMLVDQGEYHILELRFRDGCPSDGQETGMRKTQNLIKNYLFISDCFFGVLNVESVQVFEELLDNGDVVGIHDNVHHDDYYFLVELSFSRVATKGETILEHTHQLLHVFFGVVGYRVRVFL